MLSLILLFPKGRSPRRTQNLSLQGIACSSCMLLYILHIKGPYKVAKFCFVWQLKSSGFWESFFFSCELRKDHWGALEWQWKQMFTQSCKKLARAAAGHPGACQAVHFTVRMGSRHWSYTAPGGAGTQLGSKIAYFQCQKRKNECGGNACRRGPHYSPAALRHQGAGLAPSQQCALGLWLAAAFMGFPRLANHHHGATSVCWMQGFHLLWRGNKDTWKGFSFPCLQGRWSEMHPKQHRSSVLWCSMSLSDSGLHYCVPCIRNCPEVY